jgi:acetyl esterase/lipase
LVDVVRVNLPPAPVAQKAAPFVLPAPTLAEVRYGPHERQVLDFWQAKTQGNAPAPLLFYIHGGAWNAGDKSTIVRGIDAGRLLAAGISVVSINYRYIRQAEADGVQPPVAGTLGDAARALQFVRSKAREWRIDPTRIAAMGGSAGGFSSLWLLMHDDLADPKSADPISRESTRLFCAAVDSAQTTLDPRQILEWIPNTEGYGAHALGLKPVKPKESVMPLYLENREKLLPWIKEYSPFYLASKDDPPFLLFYKSKPDMGKPARDVRHTANYGAEFARHCQEVGIDCEFLYPGKEGYEKDAIVKYLIRKLTSAPTL